MHELAERVHDLDLVRLEVPDEVPAEGVAVGRVLALEILRPVLADDLDAGFGERGHLLERDVLRRDDDRHAVAHLVAQAAVTVGDLVRRGDAHVARAFAARSSRATASSDSRPSTSPFSLRRRTSASTSPTRGDSPRPSAARSAPPISSVTSRKRVK